MAGRRPADRRSTSGRRAPLEQKSAKGCSAAFFAPRGHLLAPGCQCRQFFRLFWKTVAAPDDVQVGPQQQQVTAVDFARPFLVEVENGEGGAKVCKRLSERGAFGLR